MARRALSAIATAAALLYLLIDALALALLRPLLGRLRRHPLVLAAGRRVAALGPYPTLLLVLIPLVLLEPLKLLGLYLMAAGHPAGGLALAALGELLKILTVERLYHMGKPKLLSIPWFAWGHGYVTAWLARLRASRPWRAAARIGTAVRREARDLFRRLRGALAAAR